MDAAWGKSLIDPATRRAIPVANNGNGRLEVFIACQFVGNQTILWSDVEEGLAWNVIGGSRSGLLTGVQHGVWGHPLIAFHDNLVVVVAEPGKHVDASAVPDGVELLLPDSELLAPTLHAIAERDDPDNPSDPEPIAIRLLSKSLLALQMNRTIGGQLKSDSVTVFELHGDASDPKLDNPWSIEDVLRLDADEEIADWDATPDGQLQFAVKRSDGWSTCTRAVARPEAPLICLPLEIDPSAKWTQIGRGIGKDWRELTATTLSPSGEWLAWAEWDAGGWEDGGRVRLFWRAPATC